MKKGNLLVIDDEPMIVEALQATLEETANAIFTAGNGVEGLKILETEKIHCIISDINMPKMNGVELIEKIRASGNQIPFIFYTAHGSRDLMLKAAAYGVFDFLNKPDFEGVEESVNRALQENQDTPLSEEDQISEYQKLLKELEDI